MPKVYVFASLMPMGGAYMAYHIGRLLHLHFGYEFIDVTTSKIEKPLFDYDIHITSVTPREMEKNITSEDLLVANPSYSHVLFGLRLPGRKIMYVQDFKTFKLLDCHFDLYVSVSSLVNRYVETMYGIATPIIPAFIELDRMPVSKPWHERPPGSVMIYKKHATSEHQIALDYFSRQIKKRNPTLDIANIVQGRTRTHEAFLQAIGAVRYLINLSLVEGFGLVPLEAMAMGTMVTGLDSLGSTEYMRNEQNCLVSSVTNLRQLPDVVHRALNDEVLALQCVENGIVTARNYGYGQFKAAWLAELAKLLNVTPVNA